MRIVTIPKKSGKVRTIYVPDKSEKKTLKELLPQIAEKALKACPENVIHGFTKSRSPFTNALAHVNKMYTTSFDLQDYFDSIKTSHVEGLLTPQEITTCFVDGAPRQGLPTSPAIANLAGALMDRLILKFAQENSLDFVYTRYADDLSFSYDSPNLTPILLEWIPKIVVICDFRINPSKTRTQCSVNGRRVITGVAVDSELHITRRHKRKLRAAIHQKKLATANGLRGWVKYIARKGWEKTELDNLMSEILGEDVRLDRSAVEFTGEGGFRLRA